MRSFTKVTGPRAGAAPWVKPRFISAQREEKPIGIVRVRGLLHFKAPFLFVSSCLSHWALAAAMP